MTDRILPQGTALSEIGRPFVSCDCLTKLVFIRAGLLPFLPQRNGRGVMHTEAVIFDFDGTLVHLNIDFSVMRQGVEMFLGEYGIEPDGLKVLLILEMIDEATKLIQKRIRWKVNYSIIGPTNWSPSMK
jgi:hypothetical protein